MSRAFLKNESADDPVVIPARAPLPPGTTNYVTSRGLDLLRNELAQLEREHAHVQLNESDETERTRQLALLNGRIGAINQRIATVKLVNIHEQPTDEVRFGARVHLQSRNVRLPNTDRQLTIVGVDEADASHGLIAFTAPIARLMLGKRVGDQIALRTPIGENVMEIVAISYEE
ncbi:GreA/GreB family elongation factor [Spirosoma aerophilum]